MTTVEEVLDLDRLRFHEPLYTIGRAAWYLDVRRTTFGGWAHGTSHRRADGSRRQARPIITAFEPQRQRHPVVPFIGLAEGMIATAFKKAGVSTQHIRKALVAIQDEMGIGHALASERLYTDGARILYDYARAEDDEQVLTVVVTQQRVFRPAIQQYLNKITFDGGDGLARRLILPFTSRAKVEVDPTRAFGQPILVGSGARVADLVNRRRAGDSIQDIAKDFDADPDDVADVTRAAIYFPAA
jgi:uncharacterized protein (DUF433 family)